MTTILQDFLAAGLLPIGDDDDKLNLLEEAAQALSEKIAETPLLAFRFTLVALDKAIPASDPVHQLAATTVREKWQTIANKVGASPVQVYRAVILRAIEIASTENAHIEPAVFLISANQGLNSVGDAEKDAVVTMLQKSAISSSKIITDAWASVPDLSLARLASKIKKAQVNKEELGAGFSRAVGPKGKDGQPIANGNPNWPNAGEPWALEFSSRAAEAVAAALQNSAKVYADELQELVREALLGFTKNVEKLAIRDAKSDLLWIRSSLYSPSANQGYRKLSSIDFLLHCVLDVSRSVTSIAPASVEFFIRDLVESQRPERLNLSEALSGMSSKLVTIPEAQWISKDSLEDSGRRSLLGVASKLNASESFAIQTGFPAEHEELISDLAVRLYRELQVYKLLAAK
jgi:hypothetical protein